jgi:ribosomal protein L17
MASSPVKAEDRLEGASNFNALKARVFNILEEGDLDDLVTRVMEKLTSNAGRSTYKKRQEKAKRVIFDSVKDNMMPLVAHLRTTTECFDALANLYEKKAPTQTRILKKQLCTLKMGKDETISAFFSKIAQTRDHLAAIGVAVDDDDLVQTTVDGLPDSWETFLSSFNGREVQPNFEILWHDCLKEEGRLKSINEPSTVKDHALSVKAKKWKKFPQHKGKGKKPQGKNSHFHSHLFKVRCFNCKRLGHYAKDCRNPPSQQKQKGRFLASLATEEEEPQRRRTRAATKEREQRR